MKIINIYIYIVIKYGTMKREYNLFCDNRTRKSIELYFQNISFMIA